MVSQQHCCCAFQSTLPAGERQSSSLLCVVLHYISTRAPRIGSDCPVLVARYQVTDFNPRSPWGGSDIRRSIVFLPFRTFQSTLPVGERRSVPLSWPVLLDFNPRSPWGERRLAGRGDVSDIDFNPRSPWGGATTLSRLKFANVSISIHAPRMGSDDGVEMFGDDTAISIHAPRMGSDIHGYGLRKPVSDFNPRSPHGERRIRLSRFLLRLRFQSTLPAWGATTKPRHKPSPPLISIHAPRMGSDRKRRPRRYALYISIHAPRMGSDNRRWRNERGRINFNPRSPHGERLNKFFIADIQHKFQSTLPAWGATSCNNLDFNGMSYFNPRSPHGERQDTLDAVSDYPEFQSTLPAWGATATSGYMAAQQAISIHAPRMGSDNELAARAYALI